MKQLCKCTRSQLYLAVRLPYFWVSMALLSAYSLVNILYYGITYYGYSATGILAASELYIMYDDNPFWWIFSMMIPFLCVFPFSMQPIDDRTYGTKMYLTGRLSRKAYYYSGLLCSAVTTFFVVCFHLLLSTILLFLMFGENGLTRYDAKYSSTYWSSMEGGYHYHFQWLRSYHPVVYLIVITLVFAAFCGVLSVFLYAAATYIKRDKLLILLAAGALSFGINQIYRAGNYNIYGDVTASIAGEQSGLPTILLGAAMLLISAVMIGFQIRREE